MVKVNVPTFKLNNGREIPAVGYGTWMGFVENEPNDTNGLAEFKTSVTKMIDTLSYAIDIGLRHIDTAHLYKVEPEVGQVVNKKIKEGVVKREEIFITTKVWNHMHREADVEVSVRGSLRRLNLDHVDLALIHFPMSISQDGVDEKIDYLETWRGLETVLRKGLVKSIGVSNFNVEQLKRLLANCKVKPVANQIEVNLNLGQNELVDYCKSQGIVVVAYTPYGSLIPASTVPKNSPALKQEGLPRLNDPVFAAMAKKYGKSVTQIVLRYLYERGLASVPKTVTKSRILENLTIFDFTLDKADVETLAKFDTGHRTVWNEFYQDYQNYPFARVHDKVEIPKEHLVWKNGINQDID